MMSSVLITGDAGGLYYIDDVFTETPRTAFNMCCSSDNRLRHAETSRMSPQKKAFEKKKAPTPLIHVLPPF
jgi:hypothetical protein